MDARKKSPSMPIKAQRAILLSRILLIILVFGVIFRPC
jgi:hypothetical protein